MDLVLLIKAVVLGIVEGATEFIPVSSTGHLILAQDVLNFTGRKENAFIIFIQLGAIMAVVWLYRMKFINVLRNLHRDAASRNLVVNLVVATLPAVVIGLPTEKWIEAHLFRPVSVALAFVLGGVAILLIELRKKAPTVAGVDDIPLKKALAVGCIQVLALLFPGVSRSGATIMGGLVSGLSRTAATEFSFFLAIPAMLGASLIKLLKVRDLMSAGDIPVFTVGFLVSFLAALVVIRRLLAYVSRNSFIPFAWYRIFFGLILLFFYWNNSGF
jgi:undecaprenyl-diphosphatase